jgi:hypothetical protein
MKQSCQVCKMRFLADKSDNFISLMLDKLGIKAIGRRKRKRNQVGTSIPLERIDLTGINNKIVFIKAKRARVRWNASVSPNVVGYKLYWAIGGGVNYDSDFFEVGNVTEVILPDDVPSFSILPINIEIGVTAVNKMRRESDMAKYTVIFKFTTQDSPRDSRAEAA